MNPELSQTVADKSLRCSSSSSGFTAGAAAHHTWSTYETLNNEQELVRALLVEQGMLHLVEPSAASSGADSAGAMVVAGSTAASGGFEASPGLLRTARQIGQSFSKRSKFSLDEMEVQ